VDAAALGAWSCLQGGLRSVSEHNVRTTGAEAYGKAVWSWHPLLVSSRRRKSRPDRVSAILQSAGDGGKRNSSPGRARYKPSNHCAGNAGLLRLYLYARVRSLCAICTRDRGCSKHPAFPAPSSSGRNDLQTSGALRRENAGAYLSTSSRPSEARAGTHNHECLCHATLQLQLHLQQASVAMGPCFRTRACTHL
jgi:hypothetical protein